MSKSIKLTKSDEINQSYTMQQINYYIRVATSYIELILRDLRKIPDNVQTNSIELGSTHNFIKLSKELNKELS